MKLELKTDNEQFSKPFSFALLIFLVISFLIIFASFSVHLGRISKYYEINYLCKLFLIEKSSFNFRKLSKLTNQTSKQKMWDLCKEIAK